VPKVFHVHPPTLDDRFLINRFIGNFIVIELISQVGAATSSSSS
jgi:hypothetical protein